MEEEKLSCLVFDGDVPQVSYRRTGTALERLETQSLKAKNDPTVGLLNDREIISYSFDLEKGLEGTELDDAVEIRMFQDAGLNHMLDYQIIYSCRDSLLDVKSTSITAFAITSSHLNSEFGTFKSRCNYIDVILPHSTLPLALYNAEILEKKSDVFIYFQEKATSVAVFFDGEFIYSKTLPSGLRQMHDAFVRNNNEGVSFESFMHTLTAKGVDGILYTPDDEIHIQDVTAVLERSLAEKNNVLQYARRIAGLEGFDRIFIGTSMGSIPKLNLMTRAALGIEAFPFEFFTSYYQEGDAFVDQNILLAMIEMENIALGKGANPFNLTIYPRPPKLVQRESGKLLLGTAAALMASLLYPAYLFIDGQWIGYQYDQTLAELKISRGEFETLRAQEESLKAEKEKYQDLLEKKREEMDGKLKLLRSIESKQAGTQSKTLILQTLYRDVNRHNIKISRLENSDQLYRLELQAAKDDDVTALLQSLTLHKNFRVTMEMVAYDPVIKRYVTTIQIEVGA